MSALEVVLASGENSLKLSNAKKLYSLDANSGLIDLVRLKYIKEGVSQSLQGNITYKIIHGKKYSYIN